MRPVASRLSVLAILVLLVGCDHATKLAAKSELEGAHPRQMVQGVLDLQYAENRDVVFNVLRSVLEDVRAPLLVVVGGIAVISLAWFLLRRPAAQPLVHLGVVLVTAGALGNYIDRVARGYVVDFVHVPHWPIFNVADIYVTAGACLLAWSALRKGPHLDRRAPES